MREKDEAQREAELKLQKSEDAVKELKAEKGRNKNDLMVARRELGEGERPCLSLHFCCNSAKGSCLLPVLLQR